MKTSPKLELVLVGGPNRNRFTVFVPDKRCDRLAEHTFDWRADSTALHMDLGALARAVISGKPPEDDLHIQFGQNLYDAVFAGELGELW